MRHFFAHSAENLPEAFWQALPDHLQGVAALAGTFAQFFGASTLAEAQGWLHDLGKYTIEFQSYSGDWQR